MGRFPSSLLFPRLASEQSSGCILGNYMMCFPDLLPRGKLGPRL